jgi:hypothetical protein
MLNGFDTPLAKSEPVCRCICFLWQAVFSLGTLIFYTAPWVQKDIHNAWWINNWCGFTAEVELKIECSFEQVEAEPSICCGLHDALHDGGLLPVPFDGLPLAQVPLLPQLRRKGSAFSLLTTLCSLETILPPKVFHPSCAELCRWASSGSPTRASWSMRPGGPS